MVRQVVSASRIISAPIASARCYTRPRIALSWKRIRISPPLDGAVVCDGLGPLALCIIDHKISIKLDVIYLPRLAVYIPQVQAPPHVFYQATIIPL